MSIVPGFIRTAGSPVLYPIRFMRREKGIEKATSPFLESCFLKKWLHK